jgi:hypothetical protein
MGLELLYSIFYFTESYLSNTNILLTHTIINFVRNVIDPAENPCLVSRCGKLRDSNLAIQSLKL